MKHVLWIGGPPLSGKSTMARRLARRYGLRLYSSDTRTWAHRDRALADKVDAAIRWECLDANERRRQPFEDLLAMSLHTERGPMVIEDLEALPESPLTVAEGSVLPAAAVTSGKAEWSRSVWIIPTADFYEYLLARQAIEDDAAGLYRLLRKTIEREAEKSDAPTISTDGTVDIQELHSMVEQRFQRYLEEGPRADSVEVRQRLLREMNQATVGQVRGYYAGRWAKGDPDLSIQDFVCECGQRDCDAILKLPVGLAAAGGPVLAADHISQTLAQPSQWIESR